MPLPEMWFVQQENNFETFLNGGEAEKEYDRVIAELKTYAAENGEFTGDEQVYMGQVHQHAQVVPVGMGDEDEEIFDLVSYDCEVK